MRASLWFFAILVCLVPGCTIATESTIMILDREYLINAYNVMEAWEAAGSPFPLPPEGVGVLTTFCSLLLIVDAAILLAARPIINRIAPKNKT